MLRRTLVSVFAVAAGPLITAVPSNATPSQEYQGACAIGVTELTPNPGDTITVTGDGFPLVPNTVPIMIDNPSQQIGIAHIDASGHFSERFVIPSNLSEGKHTISVGCAEVNATTTVNVLAATVRQSSSSDSSAAQSSSSSSSSSSATQSSSAPLVRTGSDTQPLVLAGLGAVAVGMALVLTARRRREQRLAG